MLQEMNVVTRVTEFLTIVLKKDFSWHKMNLISLHFHFLFFLRSQFKIILYIDGEDGICFSTKLLLQAWLQDLIPNIHVQIE